MDCIASSCLSAECLSQDGSCGFCATNFAGEITLAMVLFFRDFEARAIYYKIFAGIRAS
jgi:hypothetical protein